jgi:hypothetical protein
MTPSSEIALNRRVLSRIDSKLRSELAQEKREWLVKVPASPAVRAVWKRYCDTVGVPMGHGLAILLHHELASIVDEEVETLSDRLRARQAALEARDRELRDREKELNQRDRVLELFKADLDERQRELAARERNVAVVEHHLAAQLKQPTTPEPPVSRRLKLGRNDPCWCESGRKYKNCHLSLEG